MAARPMTYAEISTEMETRLGSTTTYDNYLSLAIRDNLALVSQYYPYKRRVQFQIEGRHGVATSTSSGNLVDATKLQFASTDTDKVILNTTDNTWAVITSYSSTSQVGLSSDIMAAGENYKICNKYCRNQNQIYIGDVTDMVSIESVYYRGSYRNFKLLEQDKVLELDVVFTPDDTNESDARKYVDVIFNTRQRVSQATDLAGEIDGSFTAGATSVTVDGLTDSDVLEEGLLFNVEGMRETYCVTADVTVASSEATISIYPPMEDAPTDGADVTFIGSTLDNIVEAPFIRLCVADCLLQYNTTRADAITINSREFSNRMELRRQEYTIALNNIKNLSPRKSYKRYPTGA